MIKNGNIFFVDSEKADVTCQKAEGLYLKDMRYLSVYKVMWNNKIIYGSVREQNNIEKVVYEVDESISIELERWIYENSMYERICFVNRSSDCLTGNFDIYHEHDFKDIFIIRNFRYGERGRITKNWYGEREFKIEYTGKDGIKRLISFAGDGGIQDHNLIRYRIELNPEEKKSFTQVWTVSSGEEKFSTLGIEQSYIEVQKKKVDLGYVYSSSMEGLLAQSLRDIERLKSSIDGRVYIAAGVPYYSSLFGRDSIIAGIQLLKRQPEILKGTLELLAMYQGKEVNNYLEEEPGKILHELREGELANTRQAPFYPYYGSIDSTPLFLIGAAEYFKFTGDRPFLNNILEPAIKALQWIDNYGDRDGDGFVEYIQLSSKGSRNHGWKDSEDSMVHKDGSLAKGPIALSEVQGYVYKAKMEWSSILQMLGYTDMFMKLKKDAALLKARFNEKFWMDGYFAMAIDGDKKRLEVISSNPLHCLFCGIIDDDKVHAVVNRAFKDDMFSQYGIRTLSNMEKAYNPLSYHNGSIWPHDNSLIALGLRKYGCRRELKMLAEAIFRAGNLMKNLQIPELYGGEELKLYEQACVPQAWAAGAVILLNDLLK